jgi:hypothetical protein
MELMVLTYIITIAITVATVTTYTNSRREECSRLGH